jgi:hypothetical protein
MARAGIEPSGLEVNLGGFPVNGYPSEANNGFFPTCPTSYTPVQQCVTWFFSNNPAYGTVNPENYVAQGVSGVRFQFGLFGGAGSTPWNAAGVVSQAWLTSLEPFFADLKKFGISYVTPTPAMIETWTTTTLPTPVTNLASCGQTQPMIFFQWLPFGLDVNNNDLPNEQGNNYTYNCSVTNPSFWGWTPFFNLMGGVLGQAQAAGLEVRELDIFNEVNLQNFTVEGRMLVDNTTKPPTLVIQALGQQMAKYGFSSGRVTLSATTENLPAADGSSFDCGSVYGDSAFIERTSQLLAAFGGAAIGQEPYWTYTSNGLTCYNPADPPNTCGAIGSPGWTACATKGMYPLAASQAVPTVQDLHAKPCMLSAILGGSCVTADDATTFATDLYRDIYTFLAYRGLTGSLVMIGETTSNQPGSVACEGAIQAGATQNVNGFLAGALYASDAPNVVMRPWENASAYDVGGDTGSCYQTPAPIGKGYGPYDPTTP